MKTFAILVAAAVCCGATQADAGKYQYGMTSIGFPMSSYSADRGWVTASMGPGCGCEAACDTGCRDCSGAWDGFCARKRCHFKGLFQHCKKRSCCEPVCCEPAPCCEPEPCCDPCGKRCSLFGGLFHKHRSCCKPACCEPAPCCEPEPCCDPCGKRCKLFGGLFHKHRGCCEPTCEAGCGCGGGIDYGYEIEGEAVPHPAPVEEPMAYRGGLFKLMPVAFGG